MKITGEESFFPPVRHQVAPEISRLVRGALVILVDVLEERFVPTCIEKTRPMATANSRWALPVQTGVACLFKIFGFYIIS